MAAEVFAAVAAFLVAAARVRLTEAAVFVPP